MPTTPQETRTRFDDDNDGTVDRIEYTSVTRKPEISHVL